MTDRIKVIQRDLSHTWLLRIQETPQGDTIVRTSTPLPLSPSEDEKEPEEAGQAD